MKNIIFLLFTSLLASSLIVGCGSSSGGDGDKNNNNKTVDLPGTNGVNANIKDDNKGDKPKAIPGCQDKDAGLPNCKK